MTPNKLQFQPGLSLNEFLRDYGTQAQCEAALEKVRWPTGFTCPTCQSHSHCIVWHGKVKTFQYNRCHTQVTLTGGDNLPRHQAVPGHMVPSHVLSNPDQEQRLRLGVEAFSRCLLPYCLASQTQAHPSDVRAGRNDYPVRPG